MENQRINGLTDPVVIKHLTINVTGGRMANERPFTVREISYDLVLYLQIVTNL